MSGRIPRRVNWRWRPGGPRGSEAARAFERRRRACAAAGARCGGGCRRAGEHDERRQPCLLPESRSDREARHGGARGGLRGSFGRRRRDGGQIRDGRRSAYNCEALGSRWCAGKTARWVPIVGQGAAAALSYGLVKWLGEQHVRECLAVRSRVAALLPYEKDSLKKNAQQS